MVFCLFPEISSGQCGSIDFKADVVKGCSPLIVQFVASNVPNGSKLSWDFGNGKVSGKDTVKKIFTSPGLYDISLDVILSNNTKCQTIKKTDFIEVYSIPDPKFSISPGKVICNGPVKVTLKDITQNSSKRDWVIDGTSYPNGSKTVSQILSPGKRNVTLKVTNQDGCTGIKNDFIKVFGTPKIDFCTDIIQKPSSMTVTFKPWLEYDLQSEVSSYSWTFQGGSPSSSNKKNPTINYNNISTPYDVELTVKTKSGCTYTYKADNYIQKFIKISGKHVCIKDTVSLQYIYKDTLNDLKWNFGSGQVAQNNNKFNISYDEPGEKIFTLTFYHKIDSCYSKVTFKNFLTTEGAKAAFSSPVVAACEAPASFTFTSNSILPDSGTVKYQWFFYDTTGKQVAGSPLGPLSVDTASFTFNDEGYFDVQLVTTHSSGCKDTLRQNKYLTILTPEADFEADTNIICTGEGVKFLDLTIPKEEKGIQNYRYEWLFTNLDTIGIERKSKSNKPNINFDYPGWYTGQLIVKNSNACVDTIIKDSIIKVVGLKIDFNYSTDLCIPYSTTLTPQIIANENDGIKDSLAYNWKDLSLIGKISDTAAQSPAYETQNIGNNKISLEVTSKNGCTRNISKSFETGVKALISHKPTYCKKEPVWFRDSSDAIVKNTNRKWIVSPANYAVISPNDSAKDIKITFLIDTCFTIKLVAIRDIVNSSYSCIDTATEKICLQTPKPDFVASDTIVYCAKTSGIIDFKSTSKGNPVLYYWNFGDGNTLKTSNDKPTHTYTRNNPPGYDVSLVAENANGCKDTILKKNYLKIIGPVPEFTTNIHQGCDSITVKFTDKSKYVKSFYFDYDDGTLDSNIIGLHDYVITDTTDSFTFIPTMLAVDQFNCNDYYQDTIKLYKTPLPTFSADSLTGCLPLTVKFHDQTKNSISWQWDFDNDGTYDAKGRKAKFTYKKNGNFDVKLKIKSTGNCEDTIVYKDFVKIKATPIADFNVSKAVACDTFLVKFENKSTLFDEFILDYGNGNADIDRTVDQVYGFDYSNKSDTTYFFPRLIAKNNTGCGDTLKKTIRVLRGVEPSLSISPTLGCRPLKVTFEDNSPNIKSRNWDFNNDGVYDDGSKKQFYTFQNPGEFSFQVALENKLGCKDTIQKKNNIKVHDLPQVSVSEPDTLYCISDSIFLFGNSNSPIGIANWDWTAFNNKGVFATSQKQNPVFKFSSENQLIASLTVTDSNGCSSSDSVTLNITDGTMSNSEIQYITVDQNKDLKIIWSKNKAKEFEGFILARDSISNWIYQSANPSDTLFTDKNPDVDVQSGPYCYFLQSEDFCGNISLLGNQHCSVFLTVKSTNPSENILEWSPYTGWGQVGDYQIYRSLDGTYFSLLTTLDNNQNSYIDANLCDSNYYYFILANHPTKDFHSQSNIAMNNPPYIYQSKPLRMRYASVLNDSSIIVTWDKSVQKNVDYYTLFRGIDTLQVSDRAVINDTFFIDSDVKPNKYSYQYKVQVTDQCQNISPVSNSGKTILLKTKVDREKDRINLNWTPYQFWENGISQYKIELRDSTRKFKELTATPENVTSYIDKELHSDLDSAYCYRIVALENTIDGDMSYSNSTCSILPSRIFVPTAFSPNNDGLNDLFLVSAISVFKNEKVKYKSFKLKIFNRWGDLVFETNNPLVGWDGTLDGRVCPNDAYIYWIKALGTDGQDFFVTGTITLIR